MVAVAASLVLFIILYLLKESFGFMAEVSLFRFFTDSRWAPTDGLYNITPLVFGTLAASFGCLLICVPFGLALAFYLNFYAPSWVNQPIKRGLGLCLAVPSVVYGLWGLTVFVPLINQYRPPGASLLAGIFILAMMVFPILVITISDELELLKKKYLISANSLGLSRPTFIFKIILPQIRYPLVNITLLQLGRALGETMAVLMVCGNVIQYPSSIFDPIRTLTSNIALEMAYASSAHRSALFSTGFILMLFLCLLFALTYLFQKMQNHAKNI